MHVNVVTVSAFFDLKAYKDQKDNHAIQSWISFFGLSIILRVTKLYLSVYFSSPASVGRDAEKSNHVLGALWHHCFHRRHPETAEPQSPTSIPLNFSKVLQQHSVSSTLPNTCKSRTAADRLALLQLSCCIISMRKVLQQDCRCELGVSNGAMSVTLTGDRCKLRELQLLPILLRLLSAQRH